MAKLTVATRFTAIDQVTSVTKRINSTVAGMGKGMASVGRAASRMGGLLKTAAISLAVGAAGKALTSFGDKADDIADVANRIGLSAEALQELQYAAKAADITTEDFTSVMQKMNNNLGQMGTKTGMLYQILSKTNPRLAVQLKHVKNSDEAFSLLMESIAKETNVQKRAALAQAAFGRSGQTLIDMAGTLNEKRKEARAAGAIISNKDVEAGATFHASIIKIKAALGGISASVFGRIAASLGPVLEKFNAWILANKDFIGQKIDLVFKAIGDVFRQIGPSILRIIEMLLPVIQQLIDRALPVLVEVLSIVLDLLPPLLDLLGPVLDILVALSPAIKAVAELLKAVLVPVLQILKPILELIALLLKPVVDLVVWLSQGLGKLMGGPLQALANVMNGKRGQAAGGTREQGALAGLTPLYPNAGTETHSVSETTQRLMLDIGKVPEGFSARMRAAPAATLPTGFAFAGAAH